MDSESEDEEGDLYDEPTVVEVKEIKVSKTEQVKIQSCP